MYKIGEKTWSGGDEVTITSEPFTLHGGEYQNAVTEAGKTVTVKTPEYAKAQADAKRQEWKDQQDQFRRLR